MYGGSNPPGTSRRRCVVMYDTPSFLFITIQLGSFSLSCDILRISLIYVFATSKYSYCKLIKPSNQPIHTFGSVVILGGLIFVTSIYAYTFASLKRKNLISTTPLNDALNALILALNASAAAFVLLFTKKFKILS